MQLSTIDIEQIIRVVMERLAAAGDLMEGVAEMAEPTGQSTELVIQDRVVTTHLVEAQLDGKRTLRIGHRAVVTPAVLDLLRAKRIELVREDRSSSPARLTGSAGSASANKSGDASPASSVVAPVLVCGSAVWFNSLTRHLCPKQAGVEGCEDSAAVQLIERHLALGGQQSVWLTSRPFAAAATAQRTTKAVAVQLGSLVDLAAALEQAQPQVLIVDAPRWTVAAIGNLVRALARSR
ncbi:MAG: hypothetical protein ACTHK7_18945 [Aureliella sp.]